MPACGCARCSARARRSPNGRRSAARRRRGSGRAPCRHRHEPARALGRRGAGARGDAGACSDFEPALADEPFRQRRGAGQSAQRAADRGASRRCARRFPACPASLCQLVRHLPARQAALRPRAARLRALRRQSDARPRQPDARRWSGSRAASCSSAGSRRRHGRLQRPLDRARAPAHRDASRSAMPTAIRAPRAPRRKRDTSRRAAWPSSAGARCPFAGRVSMDLIIVDVTDVPAGAVARGDPVTLIGDDLTVDEVGRRAGTIGYEILTSLGRRYARRYRGALTLMAKRAPILRLPELRRGLQSLEGQAARPAAAGTPSSRKPAPRSPMAGPSRRARPAPRAGSSRSKACPARRKEAPRIAVRHRRTRPRHRRRLRARLGDPDRRRSRHRQVDAADAGLPPRSPAQGQRVVYISGEEAVGAGAAARRAARPRPTRRSSSPPRPMSRTSSRPCRRAGRRALVDHRFDPDHVDRDGRIGARHGDAGARLARRR